MGRPFSSRTCCVKTAPSFTSRVLACPPDLCLCVPPILHVASAHPFHRNLGTLPARLACRRAASAATLRCPGRSARRFVEFDVPGLQRRHTPAGRDWPRHRIVRPQSGRSVATKPECNIPQSPRQRQPGNVLSDHRSNSRAESAPAQKGWPSLRLVGPCESARLWADRPHRSDRLAAEATAGKLGRPRPAKSFGNVPPDPEAARRVGKPTALRG